MRSKHLCLALHQRDEESLAKKEADTEGFKTSRDLIKQQVTNIAKIYSAQEQCGNSSIISFTFCATTDHRHIRIKCMLYHLELIQLPGKSSFCCVYTGDTDQELTAQGKPNPWSLRSPSPSTLTTETAHLVQMMGQHTTCKTNTICPFSCSVSSPQLMVSLQPEVFSPSAHIMILILQLQSPSIHSGKKKKREKDILIQFSVLKTHCVKCFKTSHSSQDEWTVQVFAFLELNYMPLSHPANRHTRRMGGKIKQIKTKWSPEYVGQLYQLKFEEIICIGFGWLSYSFVTKSNWKRCKNNILTIKMFPQTPSHLYLINLNKYTALDGSHMGRGKGNCRFIRTSCKSLKQSLLKHFSTFSPEMLKTMILNPLIITNAF